MARKKGRQPRQLFFQFGSIKKAGQKRLKKPKQPRQPRLSPKTMALIEEVRQATGLSEQEALAVCAGTA